jgi:hypothetical protein
MTPKHMFLRNTLHIVADPATTLYVLNLQNSIQ